KHDPFHVSMRPPPTLTSMAKVETSHSPFMPHPTTSTTPQNLHSVPSSPSSYNRSTNLDSMNTGIRTTSTPYSPFQHSASAIAKSELNLGQTTSTASNPLFTPSPKPELRVAGVHPSASSPALLNDPRFGNTLISTTSTQ